MGTYVSKLNAQEKKNQEKLQNQENNEGLKQIIVQNDGKGSNTKILKVSDQIDQPKESQINDKNINNSLYTKEQIQKNNQLNKQIKLDETQSVPLNKNNNTKDGKVQSIQNIETPAPKTHSKYRSDIDGLRAIAVGVVVIFHAWPNFIPGGFVGVDVFFVLSGFFITGTIIKEQNFSFFSLYQRRIKRLFPAFIIVILFIIIFVCVNFTPKDIKRAALTMCASSYFSANFQLLYYDAKAGYFDAVTKTNPVLHLWSLGVDEQFYFVWPIIILLMKKVTTQRIWIGVILFTIFSFIFNMVYSQTNKSFAYYFPVCRFWQMSIGGILSAITFKFQNKIILNSLSILGLAAILICAWLYNETYAYPGAWALVPTFSTVFVVMASQSALINKHILSNQYFVILGKISYPLYLWHWPLLVFLDVLQFKKDNFQILMTVFGSVLLSILTYYIVENNLRFNKSKILIIILIALMIFIGIFTKLMADNPQKYSVIYKQANRQYNIYNIDQVMKPKPQDYTLINGKLVPHIGANWWSRKKTTISQLNFLTINTWLLDSNPFNQITSSSIYYENNNIQISKFQSINEGRNKTLFIIGDSHAQANSWRFSYLYQQSVLNNKTHEFPTIVLLAKRGVPPFNCDPFYDFMMNFINKHKPTRILFSYRWLLYWINYKQDNTINYRTPPCFYYFGTPKHAQLMRKTTSNLDLQREINQLGNTLKQIVDLGIQVYVTTVKLQGPQFAPYNMQIKDIVIDDGHTLSKADFKRYYNFTIDPLQKKILAVGAKIVDYSDYQCLDGICHRLMPNGFPTNLDWDHAHRYFGKYWATTLDFLTQF